MANDLINRLITYRLSNKLSQTELAQKLDVTFQTINRWFNRHMKPSQMQEYHIKKLISNPKDKGRKK